MTHLNKPVTALAAIAALAAGSAALVPGIAANAAPSAAHSTSPAARAHFIDSRPSWAIPAHRVSAVKGSTKVSFRVYLDWKGDPTAYAEAASTPGNALYGHFLTPAQFHQRFSPSAAQVAAVRSWLAARGFRVGAVPANRKYVPASGTLGAAATAFRTSFANYRVDGKTLRSYTSALHVPASLPQVESVVGLDQSQALIHVDKTTPAPAVYMNAQPCSAYWGEKTVANTPTPDGTVLPSSPSAFAPCGYAGSQLQSVYGMSSAIASGDDGRGVTVGIIDAYASPTIVSDVETYSKNHGLPPIAGHFTQYIAPGTTQRPENPKQDPEGWAGEETLDVEAVHTMAPGANIVLVGSPNNYQDMDAAMNHVVDKHLADIVSNSYGWSSEALPNGVIKPMLDIQAQAAAEGISLLFSSGDNGDETGGNASATPTPDWPASSPLVTAVGGTSLGISASGSRVFELGWETAKSTLTSSGAWSTPAYLYGAGGGTSRLFAQPSYQAGVVPTSMSETYGGSPMRVVPDVSALADPNTGMRVGETQTFPDGHEAYAEYRIGGTSLASPLYAGMLALAEQRAGHSLGLANPALYAAASSSIDITKDGISSYPGDVRVDYVNGVDATGGYRYSARWFDSDNSLTIHVANGYDDVTGVGVPNGQAWLQAIAGH